MAYYSGTSIVQYDEYLAIDSKHPKSREIHCYGNEGEFSEDECSNIMLAIGFARKRAKSDESEPIVIKITKPRDFLRTEHPGYPILKGRLTPENHRIYSIEEIIREHFGSSTEVYLKGFGFQ